MFSRKKKTFHKRTFLDLHPIVVSRKLAEILNKGHFNTLMGRKRTGWFYVLLERLRATVKTQMYPIFFEVYFCDHYCFILLYFYFYYYFFYLQNTMLTFVTTRASYTANNIIFYYTMRRLLSILVYTSNNTASTYNSIHMAPKHTIT